MNPQLIDRREVIAMFPGMTLRRFKRTRTYRLLRIYEIKENNYTIWYPKRKLNEVFKIIGYEV